MYELAQCTINLKQQTASIASSYQRSLDNLREPHILEFPGLLERTKVKLTSVVKAKAKAQDGKATFWTPSETENALGILRGLTSTAEALRTKMFDDELGLMKEAYDASYAKVKGVRRLLPDGPFWWTPAGFDADLDQLRNIMDKEYDDLDARTLHAMQAELSTAATNYIACIKKQGKTIPTELENLTPLRDRILSLACAKQFMYHLGRSSSPTLTPQVRNFLQAEVKDLRTKGLKEKDLLPTALYAHALDALLKKTAAR